MDAEVFRGNMIKRNKGAVLDAATQTGQAVRWQDEPNEAMNNYIHRNEYGSIYAPKDLDLSPFWRAYEELTKG